MARVAFAMGLPAAVNLSSAAVASRPKMVKWANPKVRDVVGACGASAGSFGVAVVVRAMVVMPPWGLIRCPVSNGRREAERKPSAKPTCLGGCSAAAGR
jgi:hypothetical protein